MQYLMGVDLGSTRIKSVVFDRAGNIAGSAVTNTPIEYMSNHGEDWIFYRPEKVWENVIEVMSAAAKSAGGDIACVAVTGMGMDSAPLDARGEPLYHFISWRDQRGADIFQSAAKRFGIERLYEITGQLPRYLNSVIRYMWLRENEPGLYDKTDRWLTIEDYVNYKLCGVMATDYSMASTTLLCGTDRKWSGALLDFFEIDGRLLPEILPSATVLGKISPEAARLTGLGADAIIALGGHDYQCGAVSCGGFDETKLVMSTGTYECLTTSVKTPNPTAETLSKGMSYEGHVLPGRFSLGTGLIEGGVHDWWKANFETDVMRDCGEASTQEIWAAITSRITDMNVRPNTPFFMPHLYGCDAPENDPDSKGAFVGITAGTTKRDLLYAVFEGVNFLSLSLVRNMEKAVNSKFETIHVIGSVTKNEFIMQQKADILGTSIWVEPQNTESVLLGAAILAGVGAGVYADVNEACGVLDKGLVEFVPDREMHDLYTERYQLFSRIYPSLASLHKSMPTG